jgi:hypothetical protein
MRRSCRCKTQQLPMRHGIGCLLASLFPAGSFRDLLTTYTQSAVCKASRSISDRFLMSFDCHLILPNVSTLLCRLAWWELGCSLHQME